MFFTFADFYVILIIFPILGMIVVPLRFFTRRFKGLAIGIDDWMSLVALVSAGSEDFKQSKWA